MRIASAAVLLLVLGAVTLSGCASGPSYCQRKVDDWQNKDYAENPLRTGVITDVIPAYPLLKILAFIPDYLVLNPVQFWVFDVWSGRGAPYRHDEPSSGKVAWFQGEFEQAQHASR